MLIWSPGRRLVVHFSWTCQRGTISSKAAWLKQMRRRASAWTSRAAYWYYLHQLCLRTIWPSRRLAAVAWLGSSLPLKRIRHLCKGLGDLRQDWSCWSTGRWSWGPAGESWVCYQLKVECGVDLRGKSKQLSRPCNMRQQSRFWWKSPSHCTWMDCTALCTVWIDRRRWLWWRLAAITCRHEAWFRATEHCCLRF